MDKNEKNIVINAALILREKKECILENWLELINRKISIRNKTEFDIFKAGFLELIDDFITNLAVGDFEGYYSSNKKIAKKVAYNDISYEKFIMAFHLFEDSYMPCLTEKLSDKRILLRYFSALDHLHHNTIAIVSEEYFNIKDTTANALITLVEARDDTTGNHLERTRDYLELLGRELKLDDDYIISLCKAGPLHDIGKVSIRDAILRKPFKLTKEEFDEMKRHTIIGAETIEKILCDQMVCRGYLKMARDIALYHHEKYDGSGYPKGLKGKDIPFAARIFALIDVYDAIVSKRPYKEAIDHEEAVERIKIDSGKHFDPEVVDAFLSIKNDFKTINERYKRSEAALA